MERTEVGRLLILFGVICLASIAVIGNIKAHRKPIKLKGHYLLILIFPIIGVGISVSVGSSIPFWTLFWFSIIFSIEKWSGSYTRRHRGVGKLYRFILNLSILSLLGLVIWLGVRLFSGHFIYSQLVGSLIFIAEFTLFIWMWVILSKNGWRWPSMKLTVFSLAFVSVVLVFAGVQPAVAYKDRVVSFVSPFSDYISKQFAASVAPTIPSTTSPTNTPQSGTPTPAPSPTSPALSIKPPVVNNPTNTPQPGVQTQTNVPPIPTQGISPQTGQYKNYFLGLVKAPLAQGGNGCYDSKGDFTVLINNYNAKNPTYSELVNFLQSNKTDEFTYQLSPLANAMYYGQAEDHVDLGRIKEIIDGTTQPNPPKVCADFAERLHNDAEMAGIRCGYVVVDSINHALNVFETTDKGLVFIDDTGKTSGQIATIPTTNSILFGQPASWDKVAYVSNGKDYGLVDLGSALSFGLDYSGYENWLSAKRQLDDLGKAYDNLAAGRVIVPANIYNQLQEILNQEKALSTKLGGFWQPLGLVSSYYVTWDGSWRNRN
ncbi:MAG: hypothetical protein Q7J73_07990 [Dehalococcoidales bacterium]|nr:hypothetical protein [Dehalococcoidales bacterium]